MKSPIFRWSVLSLSLAVALTGCAKGTGGGTPTPQQASQFNPSAKYTGTMTVMGFGATDEIGSTRVEKAKAALGGADVKLVEGDLDIQQFLSAVAAGDPPDIIYANRDQIGTFASRGAIVPLTACVQGEQIDTSMYNKNALAQVTFGGEVWAIPEFNQVQITMANADLLKQAGLTVADVNGSDWDKVTEATKKLVKAPGGKLEVIGFDSKLPEFLPLWAKANGADLLSADGRTAQLNSPQVVKALEFAVGVYDAQGGFAKVKAVRDSADFFGKGNQFAKDELGAMPMEQWYVNVLNDVSPKAPLAFDTFRTPQGEPLAYSSGSSWAVPKGSKQAGAACRFAKTMTLADTWKAAAQARLDKRKAEGKPFTGVLTGNVKADAEIEKMLTSGGEPWDSGVKAFYEANEHTFSLPANPADKEFKDAWQGAVNRVLNGQDQPQQALDKAQQDAQAALDKAWAGWTKRTD
ncbi:MAG: ABC transporter substrate-binding protein [Nonomuraea sp.]|nr:ABC transporter substrate-binding protein [Nonomuraea sp.]NUP69238.1 ABC transporter substrate-binding protein [Nonomuraea sp.]NUP78071.1 ABC transporter substrate-binding protein [Nonomuraea sp.]NUS06894.1 ABC transporter substrate-binding protein [Nonomuraea sp.]NUT45201.1 ABC transporter substrate-binding protein [Thermoactinospora sp.]